MANNSYLRGVRLERLFVHLGKQHGWDTARNAGSHGVWDVTWTRRDAKGSVFEAFEHIKNEGWVPEPHVSDVPDFFTYAFYKFGKGIVKQRVWCELVDGTLRQVVLWQMKCNNVKKGKKKK